MRWRAGHRPRSLLLSDRWLEPLRALVQDVLAGGAPGLRGRPGRARGDHGLQRAPWGDRVHAPPGPARGAGGDRGHSPGGRTRGHRRPHQRRRRVPVGRGPGRGRRAGQPALRGPAVPSLGPGLDGHGLPGAVDPDRAVARRVADAARCRVRRWPRWRWPPTRSRWTRCRRGAPERLALVLGTEGDGLSRAALAEARPRGPDPDGRRASTRSTSRRPRRSRPGRCARPGLPAPESERAGI